MALPLLLTSYCTAKACNHHSYLSLLCTRVTDPPPLLALSQSNVSVKDQGGGMAMAHVNEEKNLTIAQLNHQVNGSFYGLPLGLRAPSPFPPLLSPSLTFSLGRCTG